MSKDESKQVMRTKEFESFISKTSKIIERALDGSVDVLGAQLFFEDSSNGGNLGGQDGEDGVKTSEMGSSYKEKLIPLFTF